MPDLYFPLRYVSSSTIFLFLFFLHFHCKIICICIAYIYLWSFKKTYCTCTVLPKSIDTRYYGNAKLFLWVTCSALNLIRCLFNTGVETTMFLVHSPSQKKPSSTHTLLLYCKSKEVRPHFNKGDPEQVLRLSKTSLRSVFWYWQLYPFDYIMKRVECLNGL